MPATVRAMAREEETNLAVVILYRDTFGMPAARWMAGRVALSDDLLALVEAGLVCEEEDDDDAPAGIGYVFTLPAGGPH